MIRGCSCVIHGWGRIPDPSCPIHNSHTRRSRLSVVRVETDDLVCTVCRAPITHGGVGCSWGCPANFVQGCAARDQWWEPKIDADEIKAHEELLLALLKEHRATCVLCHDREDLWVTCALGEVLRSAWFNAFRLLVQPTRWSAVETVRPFQIGGVS